MRRLLAALMLTLTACSGGGDGGGTVTPPPTPTIALALSAANATAARGTTASTTVTVARGGNYTGTVTLGTGTLPAGVTVSFSPATLTGTTTSSTATITIGATAPTGASSFDITATGSGVSNATTSFTLTVPVPAITVTAGAATASAVQGTAANVPITIGRSNGFADAVTLAATGAPAGASATFAPATVAAGATSSTLVLSAGATTPTGVYPITVTASGTGVANVTTTVTLTVTAAGTPAIALSASPAALTVTAGQSATSTVTLARTGGFAGDVAATVTGAPTGMTATIAPTTIAANSTTATLNIVTTATLAPGNYTVTVSGSGTGVTSQSTAVTVTVAAPPGVTISTVTAQTLSQGTSSATAIPLVLTRVGGLTGDLTLSLEGAPTGVSATFAPNPATGPSSQMTLNASATAAAGTYTLIVRATGAGGVSGTTSFSLTVTAAATGSIVINTVPSTLTVVQGQTGLSTINIARAGGFTGGVTLTATGVPNGTQATFTPSVATGTQSQLGLNVGAATAAGTYTITIRGQGAGVTDATTTLTLTVSPTTGGGSGNVVFTFCDPTELPLLVAFRNGKTGNWSRATGDASNTYRFDITDAGGVAIVKPLSGGTADVTVWYGTAAQLTLVGQQECVTSPAGKTLTGSFAGLSATQVGTVSIGGGFAQSTLGGAPTFSVSNVALGNTDLLAFRSAQGFTGGVVTNAPDRGILRRSVNYPANSAIPVLDFNAAESFVPATAPVTVNNAGSGLLAVFAAFQTSSATFGGFTFGTLFGGANPYTVYGVPANLTRAGDFHLVQATSTTLINNVPVDSRSATQFSQNLAARTLTLGPSLTLPTYATLTTAPYARIRTTGTWQQEYGDQLYANFQQQVSGASRNWTVNVTRGYTGSGTSYDFEIPDLSTVTGWNNTWGIQSGTSVTASIFAYSTNNVATINEGLVALTAGRFGTYTP